MSDIAINIVIVPPIELQELAIGLSKNLRGGRDKLELNIKNYIPHITLLFGCIDKNKVGELQRILYENTRIIKPLQICLRGIKESTLETGDTWSSLIIKPTAELQQLYEIIIEFIKPLLSYEDINPGLYYEPSGIKKITIGWTKNHKEKSIADSYQPHLSLGIGKYIKEIGEEDFISQEIGIFQLGRYCTSRKKIGDSLFLS